MGASAAVTRVLVISMVRDLFEAESMARVMSLVFMTFMLVPVLAPNIGQAILLFAPWRAIFIVLAVYALAMLAWSWVRLPETLHPEYRRSLKLARDGRAMLATVRERQSLGYTLAMTVTFAGAGRLHLLDPANRVRGVRRAAADRPGVRVDRRADGARLLRQQPRSSGASGCAASAISARCFWRWSPRSHAAIALSGHETLLVFVIMQGLTMGCFAFTSSNFGTLAMEHMAPIAGTASSVQGVIGTLGSAPIGFVIGQAYDGTALPFLLGIAACSTAGFLIVARDRAEAIVRADPGRHAAPTRLPDARRLC